MEDFSPIWFYLVDNQPQGPLAFRDIDALVRTNDLSFESLVWKEGMSDWEQLGKIPEFLESYTQDEIEMALHLKPKPAPFQITQEEKVTNT